MEGGYNNEGKPPHKRYRRDETADPTNPNPSIVVHVRNLNPKATEADLLEALSHFGPIAYATCMSTKRMALVEFEELECARKCVVFAQTTPINVAGYPALFNYSTSQAIQRIGLESEVPNRILILTVYNAHYAINVEVIHQICAPHGEVLRIAMIKRTMVQALVEFESIEAAKKAKHAMNGADIYSGCCTLKVEFAKPDHVKVTRNDQEQWDYTNPNLRGEQQVAPSSRRALLTDEHRPAGCPPMPIPNNGPVPANAPVYGGGGYEGYVDKSYNDSTNRPVYQTAYTMDPPKHVGGGIQADHYSSSSYTQDRADYGGLTFSRDANYHTGRAGPVQQQQRGHQSHHQDSGHMYDGDYNNSSRGGGGGADNTPAVLMLYGVNHENFNCDKIFNLLCGYGNCLKVKFMRLKQDTVMVEMANSTGVQNAMKYLQDAKVFGQTLTLRPSKQNTLRDIHEPFDMPDGSTSFADFTRSRNHRFSNAESVARNRLAFPSNQLHWFNTPATMNEERLKKIFEDKKTKVPHSVTIFNTRSDRSASGLIEFDSAEDATEAMMIANHTPITESAGKPPYILKLAFGGGR